MAQDANQEKEPKTGRFLGSLKDALVAASRDDTHGSQQPTAAVAANKGGSEVVPLPPPVAAASATPPSQSAGAAAPTDSDATAPGLSAAEAARRARSGPVVTSAEQHIEMTNDGPPTTRVVRDSDNAGKGADATQLVRGKQKIQRGTFEKDPVVGWLVVVGGPGIGNYRPIFEGNNALGRASNQRIPIDFGDDAISAEEQAFIRYDSSDRSFLFVPNLAKTNVVSLNDKRPTGAVELSPMDVIMMGRTQLVFVPFCGADFDWSELADQEG